MNESRQPNDEIDGSFFCSLSANELNAQRNQLIPGLFHRTEKVDTILNGLSFRFAHQANLVTALAALIEKERVCCSCRLG